MRFTGRGNNRLEKSKPPAKGEVIRESGERTGDGKLSIYRHRCVRAWTLSGGQGIWELQSTRDMKAGANWYFQPFGLECFRIRINFVTLLPPLNLPPPLTSLQLPLSPWVFSFSSFFLEFSLCGVESCVRLRLNEVEESWEKNQHIFTDHRKYRGGFLLHGGKFLCSCFTFG